MLSPDDAKRESVPADDLVLPFRTVKSDVIGRVIRLGAVVDAVLSRHAYPDPVSHALGEALALTAMLGSALKSEAKLILQTKTDGPLELDGETLIDAAHTYFRQSEQLPTFIRLAVARHYGPSGGEGPRAWAWRAGGLMIQQLPRLGGRRGAEAPSEEDDEENWTRARHLAATVEDHELLDPTLSPERLLYRLFHEEGVRVTPPTPLAAECRCSRERIHAYLTRFSAAELAELREDDGGFTVTCEFCSRKYRFSAGDVG
jgi:molecular chaperone Hsp33